MTQGSAHGPEAYPVALYVHIPFCARKCPYCDFNTYAGMDALYDAFVQALVREIRLAGEILGRPALRTLFLGGGTPTVLAARHLEAILTAVHDAFNIAPEAELTSEANPGTVDRAKFHTLRDLGINRLSLGAQSFDPEELRFLGRIHDVQDIARAVEHARASGFDNINLDLIYGLPNQPPDTWERTLRQTLSLAPEHISCYALTVEEDTPLARWVQEGRAPPTNDDLQAERYAQAMDILGSAGYSHYEISNWARPGRECAHNLVYWRNEPYLGLGPGAHAFDLWRRWWTIRSPREYTARASTGHPPPASGQDAWERLFRWLAESTIAGWEAITPEQAQGETMVLGLRLLQEGVERARFRARFGQDPVQRYRERVERLVARGLLTVDEARIRLAPRAYPIANRVFVEFI